MKHIVVVDVADLANRFASNVFDIEIGLGGDFAADDHDVRLDVGFTGDAAELVLREARVEDRVRNRVGDFIGVTFADGFRGKNVSIAQFTLQKTSPRSVAGSRPFSIAGPSITCQTAISCARRYTRARTSRAARCAGRSTSLLRWPFRSSSRPAARASRATPRRHGLPIRNARTPADWLCWRSPPETVRGLLVRAARR